MNMNRKRKKKTDYAAKFDRPVNGKLLRIWNIPAVCVCVFFSLFVEFVLPAHIYHTFEFPYFFLAWRHHRISRFWVTRLQICYKCARVFFHSLSLSSRFYFPFFILQIFWHRVDSGWLLKSTYFTSRSLKFMKSNWSHLQGTCTYIHMTRNLIYCLFSIDWMI